MFTRRWWTCWVDCAQRDVGRVFKCAPDPESARRVRKNAYGATQVALVSAMTWGPPVGLLVLGTCHARFCCGVVETWLPLNTRCEQQGRKKRSKNARRVAANGCGKHAYIKLLRPENRHLSRNVMFAVGAGETRRSTAAAVSMCLPWGQ